MYEFLSIFDFWKLRMKRKKAYITPTGNRERVNISIHCKWKERIAQKKGQIIKILSPQWNKNGNQECRSKMCVCICVYMYPQIRACIMCICMEVCLHTYIYVYVFYINIYSNICNCYSIFLHNIQVILHRLIFVYMYTWMKAYILYICMKVCLHKNHSIYIYTIYKLNCIYKNCFHRPINIQLQSTIHLCVSNKRRDLYLFKGLLMVKNF